MPSRDEGASLDVPREAVRERVDENGLTAVAREIGMAHQSLRSFLNGSVPHGANRAKLWEWYESERNELVRLRRENRELRKRLAECDARAGKE
jgi:hypothetical protein